MLASTTCFSLSGFFGLQAVGLLGDWPVVLARFAIPLAVLGAGLGSRIRHAMREVCLVQMLRAAFLVASQALFLATASRGGLFLAVVLYNTGPLFLVLVEAAHRRRPPSRLPLLGVALGFCGVGTIHGASSGASACMVLLGVGSGICFALSQFTLYLAARDRDHHVVLVQTCLWCVLLAAVPCLWARAHPWPAADAATWVRLALALVLAGLFSLGNQWFRGLAYRRAKSAAALAPYLYFGVLASACLDAVSKGVMPSPGTGVGTLLIVGGALLPACWPSLLPLLGLCKRPSPGM